VDLSIREVVEQHHDQRRRLNDLDVGIRRGGRDRAERQALDLHGILAEVGTALSIERVGPGLDVLGF
jgi:hypothetical protein